MGGIYVAGEGSDYTVLHANIRISGDGEGLGGKISGASVENHAKLTLKDCRIHMDGRLRCATAAGGNSILKVYDSMLISHGAPWPVNEKEVTWVVGPGMNKPPVELEIEGNMRTHCTVMDSESYFYDSTIIADSWAALSTDAAGERVYLEANDCNIITTRSGYGTYADTNCHCVLNRCKLDLQNMAAIVAGESSVKLTDCEAKCGSYVIYNHIVGFGNPESVFSQVSDITIQGGHYRCDAPAVVVKSNNANILIDGANIHSHAGILIKSMINEDQKVPNPVGRDVYGVHVTLRNMTVQDHILRDDPNRALTLHVENSTLTCGLMGGIELTMDLASHWTATQDSHVVICGELALSQLDALEGVTIDAVGATTLEVPLPSGGRFRMRSSV